VVYTSVNHLLYSCALHLSTSAIPSLKVAFLVQIWYNIAQEVYNEKK